MLVEDALQRPTGQPLVRTAGVCVVGAQAIERGLLQRRKGGQRRGTMERVLKVTHKNAERERCLEGRHVHGGGDGGGVDEQHDVAERVGGAACGLDHAPLQRL